MLKLLLSEGRGYGVFYLGEEPALLIGQLVHISPVLLIPQTELKSLEETKLRHYYYDWNETHVALAMGFGSYFNHSFTPNLDWELKHSYQSIYYRVLQPILYGDELFINYNLDPLDTTPVPFQVK